MDKKKYRRQQVIETLGKQLNFDNILGIICLAILGGWIWFLWIIIKEIFKTFFI